MSVLPATTARQNFVRVVNPETINHLLEVEIANYVQVATGMMSSGRFTAIRAWRKNGAQVVPFVILDEMVLPVWSAWMTTFTWEIDVKCVPRDQCSLVLDF